jgi:AraC-like DNA-binding protein
VGHSTDVARLELNAGEVDALRAVHFARRFPPHFHETFAIGVVESGATRLRTRGGQWIARAGAILAFSPGEVHSAEPLDRSGYTYRMVYPSTAFMRAIGVDTEAVDRGAPLFRAPVIDDGAVGTTLLEAHGPLMSGVAPSGAEARLVSGLLALVDRHGSRGPGVACRADDLALAAAVRGYLHERYHQPVRLSALAGACGVSPFHLIRVFRRVVGVPPHAYLVQVRVNRAQALLGQGSSVAAVAYSCGFSDQSHLTRTFRRAVGVPPGQYVRSIRRSAA